MKTDERKTPKSSSKKAARSKPAETPAEPAPAEAPAPATATGKSRRRSGKPAQEQPVPEQTAATDLPQEQPAAGDQAMESGQNITPGQWKATTAGALKTGDGGIYNGTSFICAGRNDKGKVLLKMGPKTVAVDPSTRVDVLVKPATFDKGREAEKGLSEDSGQAGGYLADPGRFQAAEAPAAEPAREQPTGAPTHEPAGEQPVTADSPQEATDSPQEQPAGKRRRAKAPRAKKAPKERPAAVCACGCGGTTGGGRFLPGHDARLKSELLRTFRGPGLSPGQQQLVEQLGWERFLTAAPATAGASPLERARALLAKLTDAERDELLADYAVPVKRI
jgi:hypothetical protein